MHFRAGIVALSLTAALALSGCGQDPVLYVDQAWVRLPGVPANPGAAYFTVHGGPNADTLIRVSAEVAIKSEMHDVAHEAGVAKMSAIETVAVPKLGKIEFKPGGRHVMLFDLRRNLKPGGTIRLDFTFASGEKIYVDAPLVAAGGSAPGDQDKH